jgi:hypothetical protein
VTLWEFVGWSDGSTENPRRVDVASDAELRAVYAQVQEPQPPWAAIAVAGLLLGGALLYAVWRGRR